MGLTLYSRDAISTLFNHTPTTIHIPNESFPIPDQFFGIELELENVPAFFQRLTHRGPIQGWISKQDGSLRGRGSVELVSNGPRCGNTLLRDIHDLYDAFDTHELTTASNASFRTSTHVHMDFTRSERYTNGMQADSFHGAQCVVLLYYLLEEQFFHIAGPTRRRSGFSFGYDEAPTELWDFFGPNGATTTVGANRYYGLNFRSLAAHGTLEFRHLPLILNRNVLLKWLRMLCRLKLWAYNNMRQDVPSQAFVDILADRDALVRANEFIFQEYDNMPTLNGSLLAERVAELDSVLNAQRILHQQRGDGHTRRMTLDELSEGIDHLDEDEDEPLQERDPDEGAEEAPIFVEVQATPTPPQINPPSEVARSAEAGWNLSDLYYQQTLNEEIWRSLREPSSERVRDMAARLAGSNIRFSLRNNNGE